VLRLRFGCGAISGIHLFHPSSGTNPHTKASRSEKTPALRLPTFHLALVSIKSSRLAAPMCLDGLSHYRCRMDTTIRGFVSRPFVRRSHLCACCHRQSCPTAVGLDCQSLIPKLFFWLMTRDACLTGLGCHFDPPRSGSGKSGRSLVKHWQSRRSDWPLPPSIPQHAPAVFPSVGGCCRSANSRKVDRPTCRARFPLSTCPPSPNQSLAKSHETPALIQHCPPSLSFASRVKQREG
jgi:hypothetical protein